MTLIAPAATGGPFSAVWDNLDGKVSRVAVSIVTRSAQAQLESALARIPDSAIVERFHPATARSPITFLDQYLRQGGEEFHGVPTVEDRTKTAENPHPVVTRVIMFRDAKGGTVYTTQWPIPNLVSTKRRR
jgi:hypothetical protein